MLTLSPKSHGIGGKDEVILLKGLDPQGGWSPAPGFDGTEDLVCEVWAGDDRAVAATLPVAWFIADDGSSFNANKPAVVVSFPETAMTALTVGRWRLRVYIPADEEDEDSSSENLVEARFRVNPSPGVDVTPRLAYHTYKQLLDIAPWIEQLDDNFHDQLGFAELADIVRAEIDGEIMRAAAYRPCWRGMPAGVSYRDALAADSIDLTTTGGRLLSLMSAYRTVALIVERAIIVGKSPSEALSPAMYRERADAYAGNACADFTGDNSPPSLSLSYIPVSRIIRR